MQPYTGKRLAEGVEYALYLCPRCGGIGTLHGEGDTLVCSGCGLRARYTEYGFFEGEDAPFSNVRDWDAWQDAELSRRMERAAETRSDFFSDPEQTLLLIDQAHGSRPRGQGHALGNMRTLSVGKNRIPLKHCGHGRVRPGQALLSPPRENMRSAATALLWRKYTAIPGKNGEN